MDVVCLLYCSTVSFQYPFTQAAVNVRCSQTVGSFLGFSLLGVFLRSVVLGLFPLSRLAWLFRGVPGSHAVFLGSVERFRNDQSQHEVMSDRDRSSGGTGCLILDARLSDLEVDMDGLPRK